MAKFLLKKMYREQIMKRLFCIACLFCIVSKAHTQIIFTQQPPEVRTKEDTVPPLPRTKIKPYDQVIYKNYNTWRGLFTVHRLQDTLYFEIPDSVINREIMVINRLEKAPGGHGMYPGEALDERTIRFELHRADSTIRIRYTQVINTADPNSDIARAVALSNMDPVVVSFPIKAYGKKHDSYVIDLSKYMKLPHNLFHAIDPQTKLGQNVQTSKVDELTIEYIHAYPINVEISFSKTTFSRLMGARPLTPASLVTHTSFIALPEVPLQKRLFDPRVGYFNDTTFHYNDHQQKVEKRKFIVRWRLEPREEDMDKWRKGKLVEPRKPIVIYIDPATPKQWRPYLIAGINDWQQAFEQAGFKNAIIGKEWPEDNPDMHMDDARYSILNYFPSEISNAYGPQIHDPRSGEIIQTHIGWYHNVMKLLHNWYLVQTGAVDTAARHARFSEKLMGALIRFVSSHEVGHTLGLRHNFGSSSQTPVDSLRSNHYLEKYGHTASIMDYARFNYVAQPEDHIAQRNLFPRIGEYDKWAIEWGYKSSFAATVEEDAKIVRKWIENRLNKNPRLWFGDGENQRIDARCQTEDLGDDAVKASILGIKNLKRIYPNLPEWTLEEGGLFENLADIFTDITNQYKRYLVHVVKNIGGIRRLPTSEGQAGNVFEPVPKNIQQNAVAFFDTELFNTPHWLLDRKVLDKVIIPVQPNFVEELQVMALNTLLYIGKINRLMANMRQFGDHAYPVDEYIEDVHKSIWKELNMKQPIVESYRRTLQKTYIGNLQDILMANDPNQTETDVFSIVRAYLLQLKNELERAAPLATDRLTRYHLNDVLERVRKIVDTDR